MKKLLLLAFLSFPAVGQTINYTHTNIYTTDAQFGADRYQCVIQTQQPVTIADSQAGFSAYKGNAVGQATGQQTSVVMPSCDMFQQCLANRGYTRWDAGSLWASPLRCFNAAYRRFEVR